MGTRGVEAMQGPLPLLVSVALPAPGCLPGATLPQEPSPLLPLRGPDLSSPGHEGAVVPRALWVQKGRALPPQAHDSLSEAIPVSFLFETFSSVLFERAELPGGSFLRCRGM